MAAKRTWTPWREAVRLRADVRTGELTLADFATDLHDVMVQRGARPIYENPARFFSMTYPTSALLELAGEVAERLASRSPKAIRQLALTYGGGKTHTLVALRHLFHRPSELPDDPAVKQFEARIGGAPPAARVAALCFDKIDVEKGLETLGPAGERRWLLHPWSILAFQIAGAEGLRLIHAEGADAERETPPAQPLLADLLAWPQRSGLATLVLIDEVLIYAYNKVEANAEWRTVLANFFQYLSQAAVATDKCAIVASLLASDTEKDNAFGRELLAAISDRVDRQKEEPVQPVGKDDVPEVLRRRFFEPDSVARPEEFRPHAISAVKNMTAVDPDARKEARAMEARVLACYPFHPDITEIFYTKWTQIDGFQRTRGILRAFAVALRDAEAWDDGPLAGPALFLNAPGKTELSGVARDLTSTATGAAGGDGGNDWAAVLESELEKARQAQTEYRLANREVEQAAMAAFLCSQPIGQKASTRELMALAGAAGPDRIAFGKGLRRWAELSWFLDETEFAPGDSPPKAWRLGNRPNLTQMHDDACRNRVQAETVEQSLAKAIRSEKSLVKNAAAAGARVHMLPERPRDIADDGEFHFAILGPEAVSDSGKPSAAARRFIEETTAADKPRVNRNALVLAAPSREGLATARNHVRAKLGWEEVKRQIRLSGGAGEAREERLAEALKAAQKAIPETVRQAWSIIIAVNRDGKIEAFKLTIGADPLFDILKEDKRARISDSAVNPEALAPGGPYDLWRADEASRRVKDIAGAFAERPGLPRMLRRRQILDTIERGVRDGAFVAALPRPDRTARTWWRTSIDEAAWKDAALELHLPHKTELSELDPALLKPGALPELWTGKSLTVAAAAGYFANARAITVRGGEYDRQAGIPACARAAVEAAIGGAVADGMLRLVAGPASFQGEPLPDGVAMDGAELRAPMAPIDHDRLMPEALPGAWRDGKTTALALSNALSAQDDGPVPWPVLRRAIDGAAASRWLEPAAAGVWPCDATGAGAAALKLPETAPPPPPPPPPRVAEGDYAAKAKLEAGDFQDLAEALPSVIGAAAGLDLEISVELALMRGDDADAGKIDELNRLLAKTLGAKLRFEKSPPG